CDGSRIGHLSLSTRVLGVQNWRSRCYRLGWYGGGDNCGWAGSRQTRTQAIPLHTVDSHCFRRLGPLCDVHVSTPAGDRFCQHAQWNWHGTFGNVCPGASGDSGAWSGHRANLEFGFLQRADRRRWIVRGTRCWRTAVLAGALRISVASCLSAVVSWIFGFVSDCRRTLSPALSFG